MNERAAFVNDAPLRLKSRGRTILGCLILLAALVGLSHAPRLLEDTYARGVQFQIARALSVMTGGVPASLAEIALAAVGLYLLVPFFIAASQVLRRRRSARNATASGALRVSTAAMVVVSVFYLSWGLDYARAPLAARVGWPPIDRRIDAIEYERQTGEIAALAEQLVLATNDSYREFAKSDDLGRPSGRADVSRALDVELDAAYPLIQTQLGLEPEFAVARGPAKPLYASLLLNHLQLSGFYFPWTGEANYNRLMPAPSLPHSVAHEKAHQRGIAREDEANFIGYLVCAVSDDAYVRYSGELFAQNQMLRELAGRDAARTRELIRLRTRGVARDVEYIRAFWRQYDGPAARVSESVNDRYLKSQGVRSGIASYAASQSLIVLFARHNGGSAIATRPIARR